jgi:inner membrane protein
LVAVPLIALAVAALFSRGRLPSWRSYLVALVGVASNPLLDLANPYGVRILWPFSNRWVNADFLAIFDVWIWLLLALALVAPWFSRMVSREIGAAAGTGRGLAVFVLCAVAGYCGAKYFLHERALAVLDSRLYRNEIPLRVAALPSSVNPFHFVGLVEGREFFERHANLNLLSDFDPAAGIVYYKPETKPKIAAFTALLEFAQWPVWRITPVADPEGASRVELFDLRFGLPASGPFSVSAVLDSAGRTLESKSPR